MLLSVRKECSPATQIYQTLLQRSFSSSVTSAVFFFRSSSCASIFCCIKYKVFIFTCNFLSSLFLSYHILFFAHSHTFHLSIPKSRIPRFKGVPLWFLLRGASCFRKILCKQPGLSDNLPLKKFLKLCFWKLGGSWATCVLHTVVHQPRTVVVIPCALLFTCCCLLSLLDLQGKLFGI